MNQPIKVLLTIFLIVAISCSKETLPVSLEEEIIEELTCFADKPDASTLINGDPLPIVQGKILSWAVSTDDEIAYTPPGKWVNVYGTVFYRYVERAQGDAIKVNEVAATTTNILTTSQVSQFKTILENQTLLEEKGIANRENIARELIKWKDGSNGNEAKVLELAEQNGQFFSDLIIERTEVFSDIFNSLSYTQRDSMCEIRKISNHSESDTTILDNLSDGLSSEQKSVLRLLLHKFFVWSTSLVEMTKLVDDGRPAVFFGFANLRVEDRAGDNPSSGLRGESSKLIANLLDQNQNEILNKLIEDQESSLNAYYETRADLAALLMDYQSENFTPDLSKISNISKSSELEEVKLGIIQAKAMGEIIQSFSQEQMQELIDFKEGN